MQRLSLDDIPHILRRGDRAYLPGATGESIALATAFARAPDAIAGVHFVGCFVPGMNDRDYAGLHGETRVSTFMLPAAMERSFAEGRVQVIPATYYGAARLLAGMAFHVAFAHVGPPDIEGRCSLGIAADFAPLVWAKAARRVLLVNRHMPLLPRAPWLTMSDADVVVDADGPLVCAPPLRADGTSERIASLVAEIVPDHAAVQTGIGAIPTAVWARLGSHRGLALRSGLVPDGFMALGGSGALADPGQHVAGIAFGSDELYRFLADSDVVALRPTDETHAIAVLARCPRFHAINSALEVDLLGRINAAWRGGRVAGGLGGLPDFARAATISPGGRSIIALPATARAGTVSRIVPLLASQTVGIGPEAIDTVITEHGAACLEGLDFDGRAAALIAIAAPFAREMLSSAWRDLRSSF